MNKYKIVIFYEHKAREYEFAYLLKLYMTHVGFSVRIQNIYCLPRLINLIHKPTVVLVPFFYNENDKKLLKSHFITKAIIINLRYEQVYPRFFYENKFAYNHKYLEKIFNLVWGEFSYKKLIEINLEDRKIFRLGHPVFDFCREHSNIYYETKEDLSNKYGLNVEKRWVLFLSSLTINSLNANERLNFYTSNGFDKEQALTFIEISLKTKDKLIEDLISLSNERDYIVIYRPHPSEDISQIVDSSRADIQNFRIISELSARQWIYCSENIINWLSTSVVEAFMLQKKFVTYRPFEIPNVFDYDFIDKSEIINNYKDLLESVNNNKTHNLTRIKYYYDSSNRPAFVVLSENVKDLMENPSIKDKYDLKFDIYDIRNIFLIYLAYLISRFSKFTKIRLSKFARKRKKTLISIEKSSFGEHEQLNALEKRIIHSKANSLFQEFIR
jgi:surface carbohydrate biosynthesis protein